VDSHQALCSIFNRLTLWRNLPKYQLERRADIFFSLYLQEILEARLAPVTLLPDMIPEFPIKKSGEQHLTVNIDYVMFSSDLKTVCLVEFKTDMGSNRPEQFEYLQEAKSRIETNGFGGILKELVTVFEKTQDKAKYLHLFSILSKLGLISQLASVQDKLYDATSAQGVTKLIGAIQITEAANQMTSAEIIFLQPRVFTAGEILRDGLEDVICIPFSHESEFSVVNHLRRKDGALFAHQFADYIELWSTEAGKQTPPRVAESIMKPTAKYNCSE